jgi:hypothetical protein
MYVPLLREFAGLLGPWQQPVNEDIRKIWTYSFKGSTAPEVDDNLLWVLNKLVRLSLPETKFQTNIYHKAKDCLSKWRNKFASTAMALVEKLLNDLDLKIPEERAAVIKMLLGNDSKCHPYYYREFEEGKTPLVSCKDSTYLPADNHLFRAFFSRTL